MIKAEHLTKYYGSLRAVNDVSFEVKKGEILGFLGPNGAGKTTTIKMLTGSLSSSYGTASIDGLDIFEAGLEARKKLGYVPENPPLYLDMTVYSFLTFHARIKGVPKKERASRIDTTCEMFHLGDVRHTIIGKLSKGYRQRVGIAQALVHNPPVIFLDEPTVGLDPKQIIDTRNVIKSLAGSHTVLLSTHILPEVSMTCDRVVIINNGHVIAEDSPERLTQKLQGSQSLQIKVRGAGPKIEESIKAIEGVLDISFTPANDGVTTFRIETAVDQDIRGEIARTVVNAGFDLLELQSTSLTLEDVYLKLITEEEGAANE